RKCQSRAVPRNPGRKSRSGKNQSAGQRLAAVRLHGQPNLDGRRSQRRLHRHLEEGLEQWRVCRGLSQVPRQNRLIDAVQSDAELLLCRRGKSALRSADTVQHLTPSNSSNEPAGLALIAPASRPSPSLLLRIPILAELFYLGHDCAVIWHGLKSLAHAEI